MNVILFGATGMVGRSVLRECLRDDGVGSVLAVGRSATAVTHPKMRQLIQGDLFDFTATSPADLRGHDACSSASACPGREWRSPITRRLTFDLTLGWARILARLNPSLTFIYVSGAGTGGNAMWARVKGRTEDALLALLPSAYMFRLALLLPMNGEVSKTRWTRITYRFLRPLLPVWRAMSPGTVITSEELGRAMLNVARQGAASRILESRELIALGAE